MLRAVLVSMLMLPSCVSGPAPLPAPAASTAAEPRMTKAGLVVTGETTFAEGDAPDEEGIYVCGTFEGRWTCITYEAFLQARREMSPAAEPQSYDSGLIDL